MRKNFLPLLLAYNISATLASPFGIYRLKAAASLKFLAFENLPRIVVKLRLDNARRATDVDMLADNNCQPSICVCFIVWFAASRVFKQIKS